MKVVLVLITLLLAGCGAPVQPTLGSADCVDDHLRASAEATLLPRFRDDADTQARRLRLAMQQTPVDVAWTGLDSPNGEFMMGEHRYRVEMGETHLLGYHGPDALSRARIEAAVAAFYALWEVPMQDRPLGEPYETAMGITLEARQPGPYPGSVTFHSWSDPGVERPVSFLAWPLFDVAEGPWPVDADQARAKARAALECLASSATPPIAPEVFQSTDEASGPSMHLSAGHAVYSFSYSTPKVNGSCTFAAVDVDAATGAVLVARANPSAFCPYED